MPSPTSPPSYRQFNLLLLNYVSYTQTVCFLLVHLKNEKRKCQTLTNMVFIDGNEIGHLELSRMDQSRHYPSWCELIIISCLKMIFMFWILLIFSKHINLLVWDSHGQQYISTDRKQKCGPPEKAKSTRKILQILTKSVCGSFRYLEKHAK